MTAPGQGEESGRFAEPRLRDALAALCDAGGLDGRDARLLKVTNNAVFHLPHADVAIRITTTTALHHRVPKVVAVARWLADLTYPAVRLRDSVCQPLAAGDFLATVWDYVLPSDPQPDGRDLGQLLLQLHAIQAPPPPLPPLSILDDVRRRLGDADGLDDDDRDYLAQRGDALTDALASVDYALSPGAIHGDAHTGNLIRNPASTVLLLDLDSFSHGPREWDLVPAALGAVRFHNTQSYRQLVEVYGFDVTAWSGWPILRAVRELQLLASAVPRIASSSRVAAQFAHRLRTVRHADPDAAWQPYS